MKRRNGKKILFVYVAVVFCLSSGMSYAAAAKTSPPATTTGAISVTDSINGVLQNHRSLRAIQENRVAVDYERDRAKRGYGPRVDVTAGTGMSMLSDHTTRQNDDSKNFYPLHRIEATLTQPLWDGYATRSRVRATEATRDSLTHRVFDNATSLSLDAIIAHVDVLRRVEILDSSKENLGKIQNILKMAVDRESSGADTAADVAKAESRLARAKTFLVDAESDLVNAHDTYTRLTYIRTYNQLAPLEPANISYANAEAVMEEAKKTNPKLAAYLEDINAARAQQELSQSTYYPAFTLEAGPSYRNWGDKKDTWTYGFDAMLMMRWNAFNSGADDAADKAAGARVRMTRQEMYSYYDDLHLDIQNTWTALLAAREQFKFWTESMELNKTILDAYIEQFNIGTRSLIDLLDAESELYNSERNAITAKSNIVIGSYRLQALSGVLLTNMGVKIEGLFVPPTPAERDQREKY